MLLMVAMTELSDDNLIVPSHPIIFKHHVLDFLRNDSDLDLASRELTNCLEGCPFGDDQELDPAIRWPAKDARAQEAGNLSDGWKGLAP